MVKQRLAGLEKGKLMNRSRVYLALAIILLLGLACETPALPLSEDAFNTAVAQTVMVGLTEKYISPTFTSSPTSTFTPSVTPIPPTETPTLPVTITPTISLVPTITNTLAIPLQKIIVSVNTNCRTGPDKAFPVEGSLLAGHSTTVHGIDPTGQYYYIRNPDPGREYCWLSAKYATVGGAVSLLPVMTSMPTPTATVTLTPIPGLNVNFSTLENCGHSWWVNLELINKGEATFTSVLIKLKEPFKGQTVSTGSDGFSNAIGCGTPIAPVPTLEPNGSVIVSSASIGKNPTGKKLVVTVSVCTDPGGVGTCLTRTLIFKSTGPKPVP
jgi:hypothetical protein